MKKVAIFLGAMAVFSLSSCNKCAECHAAADINGTEYEIEELGEYCGDELESIEETISASKHFVKLLGKVSTTISSALFWQIANLQVGLILWVFVSLIFIFFHNPGENISFHLHNCINLYGKLWIR